MRYQCEDDAFVGDFVELSDSWSRAQTRALWTAGGEDEALFLDLLRPKIIALHLTCVDADPIRTPDDLTPERTEQMDVRLYRWFANVWWVHLRDLANLGEALGRRLLHYLRAGTEWGGEGNSRRPVEPEELLDAWLLDLFPGRMLEELDEMDLNRLYRAKVAARMQAVEGRRKRFLEGKLKSKELDADEWRLIVQMDEWAKAD